MIELNPLFGSAKNGVITGLVGGGAAIDPPAKKPYDFDAELKTSYMKPLKYDGGRSAKDVLLLAAQRGKIDPSLLLSSSYQEGFNKAILDPDSRSDAYYNAGEGFSEFPGLKPRQTQAKLDTKNFPVDGFYNYGLDTFGQNYEKLKKYLPQGFESRFQLYDAYNDKMGTDPKTGKKVATPEKIKTAAFRTNEDALIAKAAFMNMEADELTSFAKQQGVDLDKKAKDYFTMVAFNGGPGHARTMIKEYAKAKDKAAFIDKGQTSLTGVHKNVLPRLKRMALAQQLLTSK